MLIIDPHLLEAKILNAKRLFATNKAKTLKLRNFDFLYL